MVFSFDVDARTLLEEIRQEVQEMVPDYTVIIAPDLDLSD